MELCYRPHAGRSRTRPGRSGQFGILPHRSREGRRGPGAGRDAMAAGQARWRAPAGRAQTRAPRRCADGVLELRAGRPVASPGDPVARAQPTVSDTGAACVQRWAAVSDAGGGDWPGLRRPAGRAAWQTPRAEVNRVWVRSRLGGACLSRPTHPPAAGLCPRVSSKSDQPVAATQSARLLRVHPNPPPLQSQTDRLGRPSRPPCAG